MNFKNTLRKHNVTVQWVENGETKTIELRPGYSSLYKSKFLATFVNVIRISAFTDDHLSVFLNGESSLDVEPRDVEETIQVDIAADEHFQKAAPTTTPLTTITTTTTPPTTTPTTTLTTTSTTTLTTTTTTTTTSAPPSM